MSTTYDKLRELLAANNTLTVEDIEKMVAEHGEMTDEEKMQIEADRLQIEKSQKADVVTMEQYLDALKVLDTEAEGSEAYITAEALVEKYESGM